MQEYAVRPREAAMEEILYYVKEHRLEKGDRLPSEREMCAMWSLNRSTLRSAVIYLCRRGILEVRANSGIYYAGPKFQRMLQGLRSFTKEANLQGSVTQTRLLSLDRRECDRRQSGIFRVPQGTPLWHLYRLRLIDGVPLQIESCFFLTERFPDIDRFDFSKESLYRVFEEEYGAVPSQGDERIVSTRAGEEGALLDLEEEAPILRLESRTYDQHGDILEFSRTMVRPDRTTLISRMECRFTD